MHLTNACGPQQVRDGPLVRGDQRRRRTAAAAKASSYSVPEAVQGQVFGALKGLLGDTGAQAIEAMLKGA